MLRKDITSTDTVLYEYSNRINGREKREKLTYTSSDKNSIVVNAAEGKMTFQKKKPDCRSTTTLECTLL